MFRAGDTIENPVTGERLVFRATAAETNGELTAFDTYVQPNGESPRRTTTRFRPSASKSSRERSA